MADGRWPMDDGLSAMDNDAALESSLLVTHCADSTWDEGHTTILYGHCPYGEGRDTTLHGRDRSAWCFQTFEDKRTGSVA